MKISTEKALDLLPYVADIYEKLDMENYIEKSRKKYEKKKVSQVVAGVDVFKYIFRNVSKIKDEVFIIVATFEDKTKEEVRTQSLGITLSSLKQIFEDEELMGFFKSAIQ